MSSPPRVLPVGDSAASVEFGQAIDPALGARVRALDRSLARQPCPGFLEAVPSYRALLVRYDARVAPFGEVREALLARAGASGPPEPPGPLRLIPTRYGGTDGPDLAEVARLCGLTETEVVALHRGVEYTAFMLGFRPGFAYLGPLPEALEVPRRATPRERVPAGSVAVAGRQTAVYPAVSPGGWHLLGRTSLRLFDPASDPPCLIQPGDRVRFVPVRELPEPPSPPLSPASPSGAAVEVAAAGLLTTVQDQGRFGYGRWGVSAVGPMDAPALRAANRLVGNPAGAAALECTVAGPTLRFLSAAHFAVTGADLGAVLHRSDLGSWPVPLGVRVRARPGNVLAFSGRRAGCRAYVAFSGGLEAPLVLGSRSTDLASGFGGVEGRPLRAGDRLALGGVSDRTEDLLSGGLGAGDAAGAVRVVLGPQDDHFPPEALEAFLSQEYEVAASSDRAGCRLRGKPLGHRGPAEIVSDGMLPGCIQVPPDGQPIVMMADSPTSGGYPKIAAVIGADQPRLAQLLPGLDRVRFTAMGVDQAQRLLLGGA